MPGSDLPNPSSVRYLALESMRYLGLLLARAANVGAVTRADSGARTGRAGRGRFAPSRGAVMTSDVADSMSNLAEEHFSRLFRGSARLDAVSVATGAAGPWVLEYGWPALIDVPAGAWQDGRALMSPCTPAARSGASILADACLPGR